MHICATGSDAAAVSAQGARNAIITVTYAHFARYVRGQLDRFGVRDADLPDLCHEVFLVVYDKVELVPTIVCMDHGCARYVAESRPVTGAGAGTSVKS